jgi:flagellar motor protein MotB
MAEIMLLLVFCLLIALVSFLRREQTEREKLDHQLKTERLQNAQDRAFVASLEQNPKLMDRLRDLTNKGDSSAIDEFWRELVDSRAITAQLQKNGVKLKEIPDRVAAGSALREKGIDVKQALDDVEIVNAINRELAAKGEPSVSVQTVNSIFAPQQGTQVGGSGHHWPPIISLSEANGNYFKTGSAELSPQFHETLMTRIPERIANYVKEFDVDVIEVVGHTDDQQFGVRHQNTDTQQPTQDIVVRQSNLDRDLQSVLSGRSAINRLTPVDNAGLGLARAVSVVTVLRQSPLLKDYKLVPLSAAQLVNTDETLALSPSGDLPQRRRIEIRLRKSTVKEAEVSATSSIPAPAQQKRTTTAPRRAPLTIVPTPRNQQPAVH